MAAMPAYKLKLAIEQGATFTKVITWKTGAFAVPVNLTGCSARMHIRAELEDLIPLLVLTTANGRIALGGVAGTITITLSATETAALAWTTGVYDLEVEFPGGLVVRRLAGAVTVSPEVTRG